MLHKRESKSKGENYSFTTADIRSSKRKAEFPAFLFSPKV